MGAAGGSKITMDDMGAITIESTPARQRPDDHQGRRRHHRGAAAAELKGAMVNIEGTGPVAVKGKPIQLN